MAKEAKVNLCLRSSHVMLKLSRTYVMNQIHSFEKMNREILPKDDRNQSLSLGPLNFFLQR
ncbi:MAG: hypothetical protein CL674_09080 [Bdellovibrionaceae bacterium]|nr:hypothetical protein [Pseudobdellovibrionaceae bacterium]